MINNHNNNQPGTNFAFGGYGSGVLVMGEQLREVNAPVEGMQGAVQGLVNGLTLGVAGSAAVTFANSDKFELKQVFANAKSNHLGAILGAAAAMSALGAFFRYSNAEKHNEWSQKHYEFLREQATLSAGTQQQETPKNFAAREDAKKSSAVNKGVGA